MRKNKYEIIEKTYADGHKSYSVAYRFSVWQRLGIAVLILIPLAGWYLLWVILSIHYYGRDFEFKKFEEASAWMELEISDEAEAEKRELARKVVSRKRVWARRTEIIDENGYFP